MGSCGTSKRPAAAPPARGPFRTGEDGAVRIGGTTLAKALAPNRDGSPWWARTFRITTVRVVAQAFFLALFVFLLWATWFSRLGGAATDRYLVWNEDWKVEGDLKTHRIDVNDRGMRLKISLSLLKPPVLHGDNGLSQKGEGEGRAFYYYSLTRMKTEGEITINDKTEKVRGLSWMDHEFGSNQLREDQVGWDWFSLQLDNETELMLYLIRRKDGSPDPYSSGTLIKADGTTKHLKLKDFQIGILERWKSARSGGNYPIRWKVTIPAEDVELEIVPEFPDQELITNRSTRVTYWEGKVRVTGTIGNKPVGGAGYVEMTGYAGKLRI